MAYERLVGLQVADEALYARYREGMSPILAKFGGSFRYDFVLSQVLKKEAEAPMNRVFVLRFPDQAAKEGFFANPDYLKVRDAYFKPSVAASTVIAEYHLEG